MYIQFAFLLFVTKFNRHVWKHHLFTLVPEIHTSETENNKIC